MGLLKLVNQILQKFSASYSRYLRAQSQQQQQQQQQDPSNDFELGFRQSEFEPDLGFRQDPIPAKIDLTKLGSPQGPSDQGD